MRFWKKKENARWLKKNGIVYKNKGDVYSFSNDRRTKFMSHSVKLWKKVFEQAKKNYSSLRESIWTYA